MKLIALITFILFSSKAQSFVWSNKNSFSHISSGEKLSVYLPKNYSQEKSYPLVISLHGYGGSPFFQNIILPLNRLVTKNQLLLVTPKGLKDQKGKRYWNGKNCCSSNTLLGKKRDDVAYLKDLIYSVQKKYRVDSSKIFLGGHSNGGFMANRMACEASELISGIFNYAGAGYLREKECRPSREIKVLHIHGTKDKTIFYEGGDWYPGAKDTVNFWREFNFCHDSYQTSSLEKKRFQKTIKKQEWLECSGEGKVALWTINDGGHSELLNKGRVSQILDFLFRP